VKVRKALLIVAGLAVCVSGVWAFQRPFRQYPAQEYDDYPVPPDGRDPADFIFARLMYPEGGSGGFGGGFRFGGRRGFGGDWRQGRTNWTNDYPASDRHLMVILRRLTRVNNRSAEQPVNLDDDDDVFNFPFLYAGRTIGIDLTDSQTSKLRDFMDRGGFFVADDMWGDSEQVAIAELMARLYPKRPVEDLANDASVFHIMFDLNDRYQILGEWGIRSGQPLNGGVTPHWQGMFDEQGRMVAAVWLNNDTGDSWQFADDPRYPERYSALGMRMTINHIVYAMTH
jgi:Domain of unknown function (DUF4159)